MRLRRSIQREARLTLGLASLAFALLSGACSPVPAGEVPPLAVTTELPDKSAPQRDFAFVTLDGKAATSTAYRGRMTLIGFAATFDIGSQAQARFINEVAIKYTPRINALLLVLEPPEHRPMVEAFASSLNLRYDVVHADAETTSSGGPFPGHNNVPSVILLDREGREVWKNHGLIEAGPLSEAIAKHDERAR